jgi:hypothetical protein
MACSGETQGTGNAGIPGQIRLAGQLPTSA